MQKVSREFYHNWTNSVLQQQEETFGKFQIALFRISSLTKVVLIHLNNRQLASTAHNSPAGKYRPQYSLVPDPKKITSGRVPPTVQFSTGPSKLFEFPEIVRPSVRGWTYHT